MLEQSELRLASGLSGWLPLSSDAALTDPVHYSLQNGLTGLWMPADLGKKNMSNVPRIWRRSPNYPTKTNLTSHTMYT